MKFAHDSILWCIVNIQGSHNFTSKDTGELQDYKKEENKQQREEAHAHYYQLGDYQLETAKEEEKVDVLNDHRMAINHQGFPVEKRDYSYNSARN